MDDLKKGFLHKFGSENDKTLGKKELAEIYDTFYPPIYRFIYRQIGDVDISRELSSEVFHRMVKLNQNGTEHVQRLTSWLYCVARNLVIDHYRSQQHRNYLSLNDEMDELIESSYDTAEVAEIRMSTEKMRMALQKLTPDQRQVILLKFMEGLSNQEVADLLSKPVGAVKSLQHRALIALRNLLDPSEERIIA